MEEMKFDRVFDANSALLAAQNTVNNETQAILGVVSAAQAPSVKVCCHGSYRRPPTLEELAKHKKKIAVVLATTAVNVSLAIWASYALYIKPGFHSPQVLVSIMCAWTAVLSYQLYMMIGDSNYLKLKLPKHGPSQRSNFVTTRKICDIVLETNKTANKFPDGHVRFSLNKVADGYSKLVLINEQSELNKKDAESVLKNWGTETVVKESYERLLEDSTETIHTIQIAIKNVSKELKRFEGFSGLIDREVDVNQGELKAAALHILEETNAVLTSLA